jgi:hypothetical protein
MQDYLDEDPEINNQKWVCISIFTPNSIKDPEGNIIKSEHNVRAFKIRGCYATEEQARKRCEQIRQFDKYHNVFIGNVGKWLPWDDDVSNVEEAVYAESKLNDMMKSYRESQQQAKEHMETRKMEAHKQADLKKKEINKKIKEENNNVEVNNIIEKNIIETKNELKKDIKLEKEKHKLEELNKKLKEKEDLIKQEHEEIIEEEFKINELDEELKKTKEIYEKLMERYHEKKL